MIRGSLVILKTGPRTSFRCSSSARRSSASVRIERNLTTSNGRPWSPTRRWRKKIGPPSSSRDRQRDPEQQRAEQHDPDSRHDEIDEPLGTQGERSVRPGDEGEDRRAIELLHAAGGHRSLQHVHRNANDLAFVLAQLRDPSIRCHCANGQADRDLVHDVRMEDFLELVQRTR